MKRAFLISILLSNTLISIAQNLIPNPGFDSIVLCPALDLLYGDSSRIYKIAPPWFSALQPKSFPYIYNRCSRTLDFGVPVNNYKSYQQPLSGDGYGGIWTYIQAIYKEGRGYLSTPLLKELRKKSQYFVRFYVSPLSQGDFITYTDAIGLTFTDTLLPTRGLEIIAQESVGNPKGKLIKDTVGWTLVSGCYKATGGERYATIGNFRTESEISFEFTHPRSEKSGAYYIDNVSVMEFNPLPDSVILICRGEPSQKYNAAFPSATAYKWNTGSTDSIINITKSGVYTVEVSVDNCVLTDTVVVVVPPDAQKKPPILRGDTTLCEGKRMGLSAAAIYGQYAWSTGAKTPSITVTKTNNYAVTVTNRCGVYADDALITFKKCDCKVFVPTAFSPNSDGVNDDLEVYFGCDFDYKVKRFQIYNRWGTLVFRSENSPIIKWNGQMNNQKLPPDVYVWFLEYEYVEDGETKKVVESGNFTIIY